MSTPLLTTKLYIPPPHSKLVSRPHLLERLNAGLDTASGVTLVAAPAGFGKTTLVVEWLTQKNIQPSPFRLQPFKVAWLSLDEADNDPIRFFTYFVAALQTVNPELGQNTQNILDAPQPPAPDILMTMLINDIVANAVPDSNIILVLDDYHIIHEQAIHNALAFLLDHTPPQMHLVFTTRADPPLPLSRLRARRRLVELRANDLRFTPDEATTFLNEVTGLHLSTSNVSALENRTEGWIAGLQLAALSLQGQNSGDTSAFIANFTGDDRYVVDYLVEEVLNQQTSETKSFLLQTSILQRMSGPLCNVVTGREDGQALLETLGQANLFIVPLDNKREWYRYHHLFAELLQNRLQQTLPNLIPTLHCRASDWHKDNRWISEAVNHALSAKDYNRVVNLIAQSMQSMLKRGETSTLLGWLDKLPQDVVRGDPHLCVASAWARLLTGPFEGFDAVLEEAEQVVSDLPTEMVTNRQGLLAEVEAIRAIASIEQGDTSPAVIQLAQQALDDLPPDNRYLNSTLNTSLALAYHAKGDTGAAIQSFTTAKSIAEQNNNIYSVLFTGYELAKLHTEHGQLRHAEALHRQALSLVEDRFGSGARHIPLTGAAHIGLGKLLYEWNDLETARQHLEQGFEVTNQPGGIGFPREASVAMAFLHQALGNEQAATFWMQQAEDMARTAPRPQVIAQVSLHKVRLQLAQGQLTTAQRWAQASGLDISQVPDYSTEVAYLTLVRILLAQRDQKSLPASVDVTIQLLQRAEAQQRWGRAIEILALQALTYQALRQVDRALKALENALSVAEPEGYLRQFVDEGQPMANLLQLALARKITPGYTSRLLAVCKAGQVRLTTQRESQPLVEPLTERELEILNLIAAGLSNKTIAETLFITVGTVKRHSMNIYGKLGVNSRTQATVKARELNLIE